MKEELKIQVPVTVPYEQVGSRRYLILHESLYETHMPGIRKQMIRDGYEYYNVESLGGGYFRYMYVLRTALPEPVKINVEVLLHQMGRA